MSTSALSARRRSKTQRASRSGSRQYFEFLEERQLLSVVPVQTFYLPVPATSVAQALKTIHADAKAPVSTYTSIAVARDGTQIFYDHWENGFAADIANPVADEIYNAITAPGGVQIWGDGDPTNGFAPGYAADVLHAGDVIILASPSIEAPRVTSNIHFDGGDKIAATKSIAIGELNWAAYTVTLLAGSLQVAPTTDWGVSYKVPIGQNTANANSMFAYTGLAIMASKDGTTIQIDVDANGVAEKTVTLNQGESYLVNNGVKQGATVVSTDPDKPIQVNIITGNPKHTYSSRWFTLTPVDRWSSSYYTAVSTRSSNSTTVFLYNPSASPLTVTQTTRGSSGNAATLTTATVTVPARGSARVTIPDGSGAHFLAASGQPFYAVSTTDLGSYNYDWGMSLIPEKELTTQAIVGLGFGRDPTSTVNPTANGSPVWVTTVGNGNLAETVYIDFNGDNVGAFTDANGYHYDQALSLKELQRAKVFDPDGDQTAMLLYTLNPNVKLAVSWGEDPSTAAQAEPGIDAGTNVVPLPEFDAGKSATLAVDANGDGLVSPGDTLQYTIVVNNASRTTLVGLQLKDFLPAELSYVNNTLSYTLTPHNGVASAPVFVTDMFGATQFALDESGFVLPTLAGGSEFAVTFQAKISDVLPAGMAEIVNTGLITALSLDETVPIESHTPVSYNLGGLVFQDTNRNGTRDAGEPGLAGVAVNLLKGAAVVSTVTTDANGRYLFISPALGNYVIDIVDSTVRALIPSAIQTAGIDPSPVIFNGGPAITDAGIDGYMTDVRAIPARLAGRVTVNGTGIGGVAVTLTGSNDLGPIAPITVLTAADGTYAFSGILAGSYTITEAQPAGLLDGEDFAGTFGGNGAAIPGDRIGNIEMPGGTDGDNYNFTELNPAILSGFVYYDLNNDGIRDGSDIPLSGVPLTLSGISDIGIITPLSAISGPDGSYSFGNLRPGIYVVTEAAPVGNIAGKVSIGTLGGSLLDRVLSAIIVRAGDDGREYNFGELLPATVSGFVYIDSNNNGVKDAGESPVSGAKLTLTGTDDLGAITPVTVTSDADGSYSFSALRPGSYTLTQEQPAGLLDGRETKNGVAIAGSGTTDSVNFTLNPGAFADILFGEIQPASSGGIVYADTNNNGIKDAGETGIGGVQLTLTGSNDLGVIAPLTVTTAVNGAYTFGNLRPGTYAITQTQPAGYIDGLDAKNGVVLAGSSTTDAIGGLSLSSGASAASNNFGELLGGKVSGFVFGDANNNGVKDSNEAPIPGVQLILTGTNDLGAAVSIAVTTATDGSYSFSSLRPGTYSITETQPAGFLDGKDAKGGVVIVGSNVTDIISGIVITPGVTLASNNFGELVSPGISGYVFADANNNGVKDASESGIGGVQITVSGTDDLGAITPFTVTTAADGSYAFATLRPGTYTLTETQPAGYLDGKDAKGGVVIGGSNSIDTINGLTLGSGGSTINNNFGELPPAAVTGFAYVDANGNGAKDSGETGIGGVQITLTGSNDLGAIAPVVVATAADGSYSLGSLRPGTYTVTEAQPAGYLDGLDARSGVVIGGSNTSDAVTGVTLGVGASTTVIFGEQLPAGIKGFAYVDSNNNGTKDIGEDPLAGVKMTLTGVNDLGSISPIVVTTAADGSYNFGILRPGTYAITETQPAGHLDGFDTKAGAVIAGSKTSDVISGIVLGASGSEGNNFGELAPANVGGSVFADANNNGIKDAGEVGIGGVKLTLSGSNDLGAIAALSVTAAADGSYNFGTLRPGTYTVTETQPATYLDGKDAKGGIVIAGSGTIDVISGITVNSGSNAAGNTFGELLAAKLCGVVFVDTNNNGVKDSGEAAIGGVQITLTGVSDLGVITPIVVTTNSSGAYTFTNLRPGTYTITETQPAGYTDGKDALGTLGGNLGNDVIIAIPVTAGASGSNYNFGEIIGGSISGKKFKDLTGNGASADDAPLGGVTIRLYRDDGDRVRDSGDILVMTTVTASSTGAYSFNNLAKDYYFVEEVVPTGWVRTGPTLTGYYGVDMTGSASVFTGKDFTNFEVVPCHCNISCVYFIINGCDTVSTLAGNVQQGDTVKAVFTINSTDTLSLVSYAAPDSYFVAERANQQVIFDVDTGTFGPGTHSLTVVVPDSYFQIDFVCGQPLTVLGPAGSNIFYTPQGRLISADNGGTTPPKPLTTPNGTSSIAGSVYVDKNNNGKKDSGESPLVGVKITLTGVTTTGEKVKVAVFTDSSGNYKFSNLKAGIYKISEGSIEGRKDGKDTAGTKGGHVTNDVISNIVLGTSINATGYLFGEQ